MEQTLKILVILLFSLTSCGQNIKKTSSEKLLAEKVIKSLKQQDKKSFQECLVPIELFIEQDIKTTENEYNEIIDEWYTKQLNDFQEKNINLIDYEISKVLEPDREYEKWGRDFSQFKVILKNSEGKNIIIGFREIVYYNNEFKVGEYFSIKN